MFEALSDSEIKSVECGGGEDLFAAGEHPDCPMFVETGWAFHYKLLSDGARQICQLMLPGDLIDGAAVIPRAKSTTSVAAAGNGVTAHCIDAEKFRLALKNHPEIAEAFWWTIVQTDNIFREHITRIGRKNAAESLAHLLCELTVRCEMAGATEEGGVRIPFSQSEFGDLLGITPVHVSRTLTFLRQGGFLTFEKGLLRLIKREELMEFSGFDSGYLEVGFNGRPVR